MSTKAEEAFPKRKTPGQGKNQERVGRKWPKAGYQSKWAKMKQTPLSFVMPQVIVMPQVKTMLL